MLVTCGVLAGCNPQRYCQNRGYFQQIGNDTIIRDSIVTRETMVPYYVASDSGYLKAWIECVKSKPVISQIETSNGQNIQQSVIIRDNYIKVMAKIDSMAVFLKYREKEVYRNLKTSQVVVKVTNHLTKWQGFWIITGKICFSIIIVGSVLWIVWKIFSAKLTAVVSAVLGRLK